MQTIDPHAPSDKPETEQMKVIHRALARELALLPGLVQQVADGDTARARVLGDHLTLVLGMLHEHHEAEDELLWPLLHRRVPMKDQLITTMEAQHHTIVETVVALTGAQQTWTATAGATAREALVDDLLRLQAVLGEHLAVEEREILPLVHEHLSVDEWRAPQEHAMAHGPSRVSDKLLLCGLVLEDASPQERAWFLSEMPAPARLLWRLVGRRRYTRHQEVVRAQ